MINKEVLILLIKLEKTIRDSQDSLLWEYCDCGCPGKSTPRNKESVEIIRLLKAIESYK